MNKKRFLLFGILSFVVVCAGLFYWHTQRQKNYAKTRAVFAPIYEYSGRLTPEDRKSYSEFASSVMEVELSVAKKYTLPKREQLRLEAHSMTLHRNNPELLFMGHGPLPADTDVKPFQRNYSILALIAKTKLSDLPTSSRSKMIQHLETLNKRLVKNSVEAYIDKVRNIPPDSSQKPPKIAFGIESHSRSGNSNIIFQEDGSVKIPEKLKRGVINLTDIYGNAYEVDLDEPAETAMTEETDKLYAKIDQLFDQLTDAEFERLSGLSKAERSAAIDALFSSK
ncbi:hypothetical protein C6501_07425 [Candidatus Poribacteria bacterium]|nr:MAG: hypothetical protein C6501_07425 [Candidatus Poribacteria bacterium]